MPPFPSYDDALAFWYGRINYEQRTPKPGDLKLDRMRALMRLLGDPQDRLRIVHVAGSKGKGSTAAMLAAVLTRAGYRTGLFTSPHLCRVEERIQIDGRPITAEELTALLGDVRAALATAPGLEPTFFEVATALGFLHFWRRRVEAAVLEVGLGGRFDSTNVCRPVLAVVTSISFDHVQQLGNRLDQIAAEKAGIIKPRRPVVSGATAPEAAAVIERVARARRAPLRQLGADFRYDYVPGRVTAEATVLPRVCVDTTPSRPRGWMELGLLGEHQAANAAVAVSCVEVLRAEGFRVDDTAVAAGLAGVRWPARLEVLGRRPLLVLDCAHNVASAEALVATLLSTFPPGRRWLIFAGSGDKDLPGMLRVLAPHFTHAFLTRYAGSTRGMPAEELAALLHRTADLPHSACPTALDAWRAARERAAPDDLICVTGSVFLAGELRGPLAASHSRER
ncbi:MAG TPA: folylpolyglutamate synthase/dihydrofolate synthase family protein [Gemmataceae bacterium]|nr:folylpolyglutamate synthase/dihydrofolate synthase family protein [Gemmataceae bacterium]